MKLSVEVNKILSRLKNGENRFEKLYDTTYKHLLIIARMYIRDKSLAEDALSEAYISAYKNIDVFSEDKNGYNWLCKIVQNKAYNINASTKNYEKLDENLEDISNSFDDLIDKCDMGKILNQLNSQEKELIYLKFFEDKTYQEIADIKKVSAPMIHKNVKRILKKIEKILKIFGNG